MRRKNYLAILAIIFSVVAMFSQEINIVKEGYFIMYDDQGVKFDQKATEAEAIQGLFNYQVKTGRIGTYVAPSMRIDFKDIVTGVQDTIYINKDLVNMQIIDTIEVDVFKWNISDKFTTYFKSPYCDLYVVKKDSTQIFDQGHYLLTLLRTKDWPKCETTYDYISHKDIIDFTITEQPNVIDGVLNMGANDFCQAWFTLYDGEFPQQIKHSDVEYSYKWLHHTISITDFDPGSTYEITGYVTNKAGDTLQSDTVIYNHAAVVDVDFITSGFKYYTVWVEESSITTTSAKLRSWTTENCSVQIQLGESIDSLEVYQTDTGMNDSHPGYWQHGRIIDGLKPNTTYFFQLTNTNISGETIISSIHSFKTL